MEKLYEIKVTLQPDDDETEIVKEYKFNKPGTMSFSRYMKGVSKDVLGASKTLLVDNIVSDQEETLKSDIEEYPALALSIAEKLLYSLGLAKDVNFKKI